MMQHSFNDVGYTYLLTDCGTVLSNIGSFAQRSYSQ